MQNWRIVLLTALLALSSCSGHLPSDSAAAGPDREEQAPAVIAASDVTIATSPVSDIESDELLEWHLDRTIQSSDTPFFVTSVDDIAWVTHWNSYGIEAHSGSSGDLLAQFEHTPTGASELTSILKNDEEVWRSWGRSIKHDYNSNPSGVIGQLHSTLIIQDQVWMAQANTPEIAIVDPVSGSLVATLPLPDKAWIIIQVEDEVWVMTYQGTISVFDTISFEQLRSIEVPGGRHMITVGPDVWVSTSEGIRVIDPTNGEARQTVEIDGAGFMTLAGNTVLIGNAVDPVVSVINANLVEVVQTIELPSFGARSASVGDTVWIPLPDLDQIVILASQLTKQASQPRWESTGPLEGLVLPTDIATDGQEVWVTEFGRSTITVLDPLTKEPTRTHDVSGDAIDSQVEFWPGSMIAIDGTVWFADDSTGQLRALLPDGSEVTHDLESNAFPRLQAGQEGDVWVIFNGFLGLIHNQSPDELSVTGWPENEDGLLIVGDHYWVSSPEDDLIEVHHTETSEVIGTIDIDFPTTMALVGDDVWIDTGNGAATSIINSETRTTVGTIPSLGPAQVLSVGHTAWVNSSHSPGILIFDTSTLEVVQTLAPNSEILKIIAVGDDIWALLSSDTGDRQVVVYKQTT